MLFEQLTYHIKETHHVLQHYAVKAINIGLTTRNYLIGFYIKEYELAGEDRAQYGGQLLEKLASELSQKGLKNISAPELSRFRQFYDTYPEILGTLSQKSLQIPPSILGTASQESKSPIKSNDKKDSLKLITHLSFSHFAELIKIKDPLKRKFYETECIKGTWGVRELRRQINSLFFERTGLSSNPQRMLNLINNTEKSTPEELIKSPFAFEFLGLKAKEVILESDIEEAIMDHIQNFLLELGNGFCFEDRQKKILIDDEYFFIDLVFYHRILHCHVLIEIKAEEFKHEHIGQLNVYLEHYKRKIMSEQDNLPVGILLVTNKNDTLVEYAKGSLDNKMFISKYLLELPVKEELIAIIEQEKNNFN